MKGNKKIMLYSINPQQDLKTSKDYFDKRVLIDGEHTFFEKN
ncbi:MAG: hypothetical protein WDA59_07650 [Methanofastidiosum sp.]|jgi:hypothetical protein